MGNPQDVPETCVDINGDGGTDVADVVYLLTWLFGGGDAPVACTQPVGLDEAVAWLEDWGKEREFGLDIAGAWLGTSDFGTTVLISIGAGGAYAFDTSIAFGDGWEARFQVASSTQRHGTWTRTGPSQIRFKALAMTFDPQGTPNHWIRMNATVDFNGDFKEMTVSGTWDVLAFQEDPIDPGAPVEFTTPTNTVARRLTP